jgi:hypothetical protein
VKQSKKNIHQSIEEDVVKKLKKGLGPEPVWKSNKDNAVNETIFWYTSEK